MNKRFILIEAKEQRVSVLMEDPKQGGWLNKMYKFLDVQLIASAYAFINGVEYALTVDEEGLINGTEDFFYIPGTGNPFAGNAIISTIDDEGEMGSVDLQIEDLKKQIVFLDRNGLRRAIQEGKIL
jgi:hypothetical protein